MATTDEATNRPELNMTRLVLGVDLLRGAWRPRDVAQLCGVIARLRALPLPPAYVDGLQDELLQMVGGTIQQEAPIKVYLAFYGTSNRAEFVKVGVAKTVRSRLASFSTGNPMPRVCAYAAVIGGRQRAMQVESKLLAHLGPDRTQGEWARARMPLDAVPEFVAGLAVVATEFLGKPVNFEPVE